MLIDRSLDVRPKLGDTIGVVTSTRIGKCVWSQDIQPESYLSTGVTFSEWSWAYDRSCVFRPKSGIRPELCPLTEVRHTIGVVSSDHRREYNWSHVF
jgi:hypothetical protein